MAMKFLVLWQIDLGLLSQALVKAIARMPDSAPTSSAAAR